MTSTKKTLSQKIYSLAWMSLAMLSTLYLVTLMTGEPARQEQVESKRKHPIEQKAGSQVTLSLSPPSTLVRETEFPTGKIPELKYEVRKLSSRLGNIEENNTNNMNRLEQTKNSSGPITSSISKAPQDPSKKTKTTKPTATSDWKTNTLLAALSKKNMQRKKMPSVQVKVLPLPEKGFGDTAHIEPLPRNTGQKSASKTIFGVRLGVAKTLDEIRSSWRQIRQHHKTLLSQLEGRYVEVAGHNGNYFELIVGPLANIADAVLLCARLHSDNVSCEQVHFIGTQL